jgi:GH24 family phage-related lysozyme (muramidase)
VDALNGTVRPVLAYAFFLLYAGVKYAQALTFMHGGALPWVQDAEMLLRKDAALAESAVSRLIAVTLTDAQFDALVSFVFNLGAGALQRSTLRRRVNRQEHVEAPHEFMKWVWAAGRKLPGLIKRRSAEAILYAG